MTLIALLLVVMLIGFVVVFIMVKLALRINAKLRPDSTPSPPQWRTQIVIQQLQHSFTKRIVAIFILGLIMAIPLTIVEGVVGERSRYYDQVIREIANLWGHQQVIQGPILVLPFVEKFVSEEEVKNDAGETETKSKTHYRNQTAVILPQSLELFADIKERYRKRAIYKSLVYAAKLKLRADFAQPDLSDLSTHLHRIEWHKARIVVGVSDTKSIDSISQLSWNGKAQRLASGTGVVDFIRNGFHAPLSGMGPDALNHRLELDLDLNGSHGLRFAPLGETTTAQVSSSWPHPSFAGNLLPDEHSIDASGFTASWEIPHLARNYPQMWVLDKTQVEITELLAGVDLFEPVFIYSRITRAVKYGLLIVALTYLTFLVFELTTGSALHIVQYGLIGAALALFYLLLLSLAEHIGFTNAYLGATGSSVGLISCYVGAASRSIGRGGFLFCLLAMLYGLLYALLQMEDYALLAGSLVLFAVLIVLMYLTRGLKVEDKPLPDPIALD